ncbi:hypothetical protein YC2023_045261 [Brassica napus]
MCFIYQCFELFSQFLLSSTNTKYHFIDFFFGVEFWCQSCECEGSGMFWKVDVALFKKRCSFQYFPDVVLCDRYHLTSCASCVSTLISVDSIFVPLFSSELSGSIHVESAAPTFIASVDRRRIIHIDRRWCYPVDRCLRCTADRCLSFWLA